jgi:hypothetical protein
MWCTGLGDGVRRGFNWGEGKPVTGHLRKPDIHSPQHHVQSDRPPTVFRDAVSKLKGRFGVVGRQHHDCIREEFRLIIAR